MTRANPAPRLRAAAYCRIAGGEEQSAILESQKTCYTERIGANPAYQHRPAAYQYRVIFFQKSPRNHGIQTSEKCTQNSCQ